VQIALTLVIFTAIFRTTMAETRRIGYHGGRTVGSSGVCDVSNSAGKHVEKEVTLYLREECGRLPQLSRMMNADLKAIATNASVQDTLKVIRPDLQVRAHRRRL
jgi:hypothetical protein